MNMAICRKSACLAVVALLLVAPALPAEDEVPQVTPEGMKLLKRTDSRVVYVMPGATLEPYTKVALLDCYVAFAKDWEHDYNRDVTPDRRIRTSDMERIKADLAEEFRKIFTEELTGAGHDVVDTAGPDVLVVRPAIVNLEPTAPDVRSAAFSHVIVRSAGQMTLFMELYDSETSAIIARILDAEADDRTFAQEANRTTNRMAADRILRSWAEELARHLGAVRKETTASRPE